MSEELLRRLNLRATYPGNGLVDDVPASADWRLAASEIQRLRAELAELRKPATDEELVEAVQQAVYDREMPDGDGLSVLLHNSDYIDGSAPLDEQLRQARELCRGIGGAVLAAVVPRIRAAALEEAACVCDMISGDWDACSEKCAKEIRKRAAICELGQKGGENGR